MSPQGETRTPRTRAPAGLHRLKREPRPRAPHVPALGRGTSGAVGARWLAGLRARGRAAARRDIARGETRTPRTRAPLCFHRLERELRPRAPHPPAWASSPFLTPTDHLVRATRAAERKHGRRATLSALTSAARGGQVRVVRGPAVATSSSGAERPMVQCACV